MGNEPFLFIIFVVAMFVFFSQYSNSIIEQAISQSVPESQKIIIFDNNLKNQVSQLNFDNTIHNTEFGTCLYGKFSNDSIIVNEFGVNKNNYSVSSSSANYSCSTVNYVGTLHSHPSCNLALSNTDIRSAKLAESLASCVSCVGSQIVCYGKESGFVKPMIMEWGDVN